MTTRLRDLGRIRHEHHSVAVPDDVRLEIFRRYGSGPKTAKGLGVSWSTASALLERGGVVRVDVLERVKERLRSAS